MSRRGETLSWIKLPISSINAEPVEAGFIKEEMAKFQHVQGVTDMAVHEIRLTDPTPIKQRHRPLNRAMQSVVNDNNVAEPDASGKCY